MHFVINGTVFESKSDARKYESVEEMREALKDADVLNLVNWAWRQKQVRQIAVRARNERMKEVMAVIKASK